MLHRIRQHMKSYFLTGLVVLLPAIVSVKVLLWFMTYVDNVLKPVLEEVFGRYFFGIGICLIIVFILVVGVVAKNYFGRKLVGLVQSIFDRLPFIRTVYSVVRQLIEPFSSETGNAFRQVVLMEYPMPGRFAIGFIANDDVGTRDGEKLVTVFLPSNHLHLGYLVVLPATHVTPLDISVEDALKTIVSCGIVVPHKLDIRDASAIGGATGLPDVLEAPPA